MDINWLLNGHINEDYTEPSDKLEQYKKEVSFFISDAVGDVIIDDNIHTAMHLVEMDNKLFSSDKAPLEKEYDTFLLNKHIDLEKKNLSRKIDSYWQTKSYAYLPTKELREKREMQNIDLAFDVMNSNQYDNWKNIEITEQKDILPYGWQKMLINNEDVIYFNKNMYFTCLERPLYDKVISLNDDHTVKTKQIIYNDNLCYKLMMTKNNDIWEDDSDTFEYFISGNKLFNTNTWKLTSHEFEKGGWQGVKMGLYTFWLDEKNIELDKLYHNIKPKPTPNKLKFKPTI